MKSKVPAAVLWVVATVGAANASESDSRCRVQVGINTSTLPVARVAATASAQGVRGLSGPSSRARGSPWLA